ncbi:hypothetical protein [Actinomyces howellii]|uniref:Uncharacterized protein n=1 Tax=Actinomyces howellii TaxID=52771 RepID=A0A448HE61_9ACTO|nr:hypothetical protein [Actinomyces howellii]VEG26021.1 Uncharacterised protein [Actinomyces howellii]
MATSPAVVSRVVPSGPYPSMPLDVLVPVDIAVPAAAESVGLTVTHSKSPHALVGL